MLPYNFKVFNNSFLPRLLACVYSRLSTVNIQKKFKKYSIINLTKYK
jgi:hypothetical protein